MKKTIFEEMGGTYIRHGDYLIPALTLPVFEGIPQIAISEYAYKRQAEWLFG
mgnify:CR=1 FL=1